ncbi:transcription factor [Trapelia coarctata]|nr:transcription factor [Trapelia coarctata]
MPLAANRRSARKRAATSRKIEAIESSPSRPSKKRKACYLFLTTTTRSPPKQDADNVPPEIFDEESSDVAEAQSYTAAADEIIPHLLEAKYSVIVGLEYQNKDSDIAAAGTVSAYAKIAGRTWTYYVVEPAINIGRSPDGSSRPSTDPTNQSSPAPLPEEPTTAHVDLGPSKLVSRVHANVFYENDDEKWHIKVNGRNGVRVNDLLLRRGQQQRLDSGDIIEIAGTEMIFVAPEVRAVVQPQYLARLNEPIKEEEAEPSRWSSDVHSHPEPPVQMKYTPAQAMAQAPAPTLAPSNGQTVIAPAPPNFSKPTTPPIKSQPPMPQSLNRASFGHEVSMESSEKIDYSLDAHKDKKPPCSYATLISQAILSGEGEKMALADIYTWIMDNFSYYRHLQGNWQNSIRHNLSLGKAFVKQARESHQPGKGSMWRIADERKEQIKADGLKMTSRGGARRSSNPNSPAPKRSPIKTPPKIQPPTGYQSVYKTSPNEQTSPLTPYPPAAQESYTPSRGSRTSALGQADNQLLPQLSDDASPLPNRPYLATHAAAAGSPPTLASAAYFNNSHQGEYESVYTPAPQRYEPKLTVPSTAKLPSHYLNIPNSSPLPFYKVDRGFGSTPARFPESSPLKGTKSVPAAALQSSSPPPVLANGSPTKPRGVSADVPTNGQTMSQVQSMNNGPAPMEEEEDDDKLDLMR